MRRRLRLLRSGSRADARHRQRRAGPGAPRARRDGRDRFARDRERGPCSAEVEASRRALCHKASARCYLRIRIAGRRRGNRVASSDTGTAASRDSNSNRSGGSHALSPRLLRPFYPLWPPTQCNCGRLLSVRLAAFRTIAPRHRIGSEAAFQLTRRFLHASGHEVSVPLSEGEDSMPKRLICSVLLVIAAAAFSPLATAEAANDGIVKFKSAYPMPETIERMKKDIADKGIKFLDEIDQAKLAADAGITLLPSTLLVFGSPPLGTLFITADPDAGLDWPVRVLVYQDAKGDVWVAYTDFAWIKKRHGIKSREKEFKMATEVIISITSTVKAK